MIANIMHYGRARSKHLPSIVAAAKMFAAVWRSDFCLTVPLAVKYMFENQILFMIDTDFRRMLGYLAIITCTTEKSCKLACACCEKALDDTG